MLTSRLHHGEWDDMMGPSAIGRGNAAPTHEVYRDTTFEMDFGRHDQDDTLFFAFQLCHRWNRGAVRFHAHVIPMSTWVPGAPTKDVYWGYKYWFCSDGVAIPAAVGWTASNYTLSLAPTDQYLPKLVSIVTVPPAALPRESDILLIELTRLGTSPNDTYNDAKTTPPGTAAANLALLSFDVHYQTNKPGTILELPTS
jgi:hypothetical protein